MILPPFTKQAIIIHPQIQVKMYSSCLKKLDNFQLIKIPSEMEVELRYNYKLLTLLTWHKLSTWFTLLTWFTL